jgi:hypothetical protein
MTTQKFEYDESLSSDSETSGAVVPFPATATSATLRFVDMSKWDSEPIPERKWAIKDRVPLNQAGLFSGEGGTGKSILELMKNVAHVTGKDWLGSMPEPGPAIYIGAEDDENEIHIRLAAIAEHYGRTVLKHQGLRGPKLCSAKRNNSVTQKEKLVLRAAQTERLILGPLVATRRRGEMMIAARQIREKQRLAEFDARRALRKEMIEAGYKQLAKKYHPDVGGDEEKMKALNDEKAKAMPIDVDDLLNRLNERMRRKSHG